MKSLFIISVSLFLAFIFRIEIAKFQIDSIIDDHSTEISFAGSLMPVYCQIESIQNNLRNNTSNMDSFVNKINHLNQSELPSLKNTIENLQPYNNESRAIKNSLMDLYESCSDGTYKLQKIVNSYQNADSFIDYVVFGFQAYDFISDVKNVVNRIDRNKKSFETTVDIYNQSLIEETKIIISQYKWIVIVSDKVFTQKDRNILKEYISEQILENGLKTQQTESNCSKNQFLELRNAIFNP